MSCTTLKLSLTDELRAFVDANCGEGTPYATPSEFVCDLLRQRKALQEAEKARTGILAGYRDAIDGRIVELRGDLQAFLKNRPK